MISKNGQYEAIRLSSTDVQVSNLKTYKSYLIMATKSGTIGNCQCSFGKRAGTTCEHMKLVRELVALEQSPVVVEVKPTNTLQTWLKEQEEDGVILFSSH
jgi:hypothetical protein